LEKKLLGFEIWYQLLLFLAKFASICDEGWGNNKKAFGPIPITGSVSKKLIFIIPQKKNKIPKNNAKKKHTIINFVKFFK